MSALSDYAERLRVSRRWHAVLAAKDAADAIEKAVRDRDDRTSEFDKARDQRKASRINRLVVREGSHDRFLAFCEEVVGGDFKAFERLTAAEFGDLADDFEQGLTPAAARGMLAVARELQGGAA